jgi:hypothetical protein
VPPLPKKKGWLIFFGRLKNEMPFFYHCLFVIALVTNAGVLWVNWLVTPRAKLLFYPISGKALWVLRALFLSTALLAYWHPEISVAFTTALLLMGAATAAQIPLTRALGEEGVLRLAVENAAKEGLAFGLFVRLMPALFFGVLAFFLFFFFREPDSWAFWIAYGVAAYAVGLVISRTQFFLHYRKLGRRELESRRS